MTPAGNPDEIDLATLVPHWLTIAEVAQELGSSPRHIRNLIDEGLLLAVRVDREEKVPAAFLDRGAPLASLAGTITVLADSRMTSEQIIRWLFTEQTGLEGAPIEALHAGRKTEIRRRAMEEAL